MFGKFRKVEGKFVSLSKIVAACRLHKDNQISGKTDKGTERKQSQSYESLITN